MTIIVSMRLTLFTGCMMPNVLRLVENKPPSSAQQVTSDVTSRDLQVPVRVDGRSFVHVCGRLTR